jgi:hypothetical protein
MILRSKQGAEGGLAVRRFGDHGGELLVGETNERKIKRPRWVNYGLWRKGDTWTRAAGWNWWMRERAGSVEQYRQAA